MLNSQSTKEMVENPTIVILDDSEADIALLKIHLKKYIPECIFVTAESKAELLKKMEWAMPDMIISDYNLPDTNGLEVLLMMKEKFPAVPFVFITGMLNDEEKTAETILLGADGYILKHNMLSAGEKVQSIINKSLEHKSSFEAKQATKDKFDFQSEKIKELLSNHADHDMISVEFQKLLSYYMSIVD